MKFTYSSGDKPLEGYTIKRGIGHGGFGEVYYGVSDGGKEVALKLVRGNHEVEVRGVAQCLNLKHPHLVNLFDLRTDHNGDRWVVMEYIAGEPLSAVLNRHPRGVPLELTRQWFLALTQAVGYLHDNGIVHRDLKPGNLFLENGQLKVGDYGLSKFISSSQRNAQTQSVGTVYYMAPEIASGNYNKQVDVYAAGVILYEMLTGRVPFEGESAAEILMKHLTTPPDLTKVPADFVPVLSRALAKNPAHRFASMAELGRAVEAVGAAELTPVAIAVPTPVPRPARLEPITIMEPVSLRGQLAELAGSLALAPLLAGLLALVGAALRKNDGADKLVWIGNVFYLTVAICWAVLIPAKLWDGRKGDAWVRRSVMAVLGALIGLGVLWLEGWVPAAAPPLVVVTQPTVKEPPPGKGWPEAESAPRVVSQYPVRQSDWTTSAAGYMAYFALAFLAVRWWKIAERQRGQRIALYPVLVVGFWGLLLAGAFWPLQHDWFGLLALIEAAFIVQCVSPWEQPPPPQPRRMRLRYA